MRWFRRADMDLEMSLEPFKQSDRLRELVDELPADQQLAVSLFFFGDMTKKDVAHQMERTEYDVRKLLNEAFSTLRARVLEDDSLGAVLSAHYPSVRPLLSAPAVD